jgi:hypothetical protein
MNCVSRWVRCFAHQRWYERFSQTGKFEIVSQAFKPASLCEKLKVIVAAFEIRAPLSLEILVASFALLALLGAQLMLSVIHPH